MSITGIKLTLLYGVLISVTGGISLQACASNSVGLALKGNLIQNPPCILTAEDNTDVISIDFSDMVIRKITGITYRKTVPYKLVCDAPDNTGLEISLKGTVAPFDSNILKTTNKDLGIAFTFAGTLMIVNGTPMKFKNNERPEITANPVTNSKQTNIAAGDFTATATIMVSYQ